MKQRIFYAFTAMGSAVGAYPLISLRTAIAVAIMNEGGKRFLFVNADSGSKSNAGDEFTKWMRAIASRKDGAIINEIFNPKFFDSTSKQVHGMLEDGTVGKIGYGFMMGYASGLCVKKVFYSAH